MENKYVLNRLGLINFWYYQDQIFELSDGHLLLRGSNGAGKSVTMQSLIPVLLDGNTEASRLDSFGSRDCKMLDYLLGEKDVSGKDEAVGYLWAEYKKGDQYITTGIGMHGRRNSSNLNRWYFVIEDGRRIGADYDFSLLTNETSNSAVTLSKKQLKNRLVEGGSVFDKPKDYAKYISKHIFGFSNIDDFEDTISLLIQLRNPKLNNDFKPDDLENILSSSLPSLTDDNVQASAQTLDQIEKSNANIEDNQRKEKSLRPLLRAYNKYRNDQLVNLAHSSKKHQNTYQNLDRKLQETTNKKSEITEEQTVLRQSIDSKANELESQQQMQNKLAGNKLFDIAKQQTQLEADLKQAEQSLVDKSNRMIEKQNLLDTQLQKQTALENKKKQLEQSLDDLAQDLQKQTASFGFSLQHQLIISAAPDKTRVDFKQWTKEASDFHAILKDVIELFTNQERIEEEINRLDQSLEDKNAKLAELLMNRRDWENSFQNELFALKQALTDYRDSLSFEIDKSIIGTVQTNLDKIYTSEMIDYSSAVTPITDAFTQQIGQLKIDQTKLESNISDIDQAINNLQIEQDKIRSQKYPVPDRLPARVKTRAEISEGTPFYQLLDWNSEQTDQVSNKIEGALLESGILDGLVTADGGLVVGDTVLQAQPLLFKQTLADFLHADVDDDSPIAESQIANLLNSISMDFNNQDANTVVTADGEFKLGILTGKTSDTYVSQFIGATGQRRYRELQIEKIQKQINDGLAEKEDLISKLHSVAEMIDKITSEQEQLPSDDNLHSIHFELLECNHKIDSENESIAQINSLLETEKTKFQRIKFSISQKTSAIKLPKNKNDYLEADRSVSVYLMRINEWRQLATNIDNQIDRLEDVEDRISEINLDLQEREQELKVQEDEKQRLEFELKGTQEVLDKNDGLTSLKQQIRDIENNIRQIKLDQRNDYQKLNQLSSQLGSLEKDLEAYDSQIQFEQPFSELVRATFEKELQIELEGGKLDRAEFEKKLFSQKLPTTDVLTHNLEQLNRQFSIQSNDILEYRPRQINRNSIEEPDWLSEVADHSAEIDNWKMNLNVQQEIVVVLAGIDESVIKLDQRLKKQIDLNKEVLTQNEEELFRTIIFDSLGKIIRQRINKAQDWVDEINLVLHQQENNSNLKLNIKWEIKPSDDLSDSDNQEGVNLLKKDPNSLKEKDLNTIKRFLNSKIDTRRTEYEEEGKPVQMTSILREALDYRQWFQFRMFYTQTGKTKRQLTIAVFNRFSGGEKAITMYTPLFVAMSARYDNAEDFAPRIITLDEAFAGIDESNISQLFKTINQLGFNYIMNSQQLDATYSTVTSLNIYQLIRAKGEAGDLVTTLKIHWNGKNKETSDE